MLASKEEVTSDRHTSHHPQSTSGCFALTLITCSQRLAISILIYYGAEGNYIAAFLGLGLAELRHSRQPTWGHRWRLRH